MSWCLASVFCEVFTLCRPFLLVLKLFCVLSCPVLSCGIVSCVFSLGLSALCMNVWNIARRFVFFYVRASHRIRCFVVLCGHQESSESYLFSNFALEFKKEYNTVSILAQPRGMIRVHLLRSQVGLDKTQH